MEHFINEDYLYGLKLILCTFYNNSFNSKRSLICLKINKSRPFYNYTFVVE